MENAKKLERTEMRMLKRYMAPDCKTFTLFHATATIVALNILETFSGEIGYIQLGGKNVRDREIK